MKRLRINRIMVAGLFLGMLAIAIFRAREPRYEGRTLTEWIEASIDGDRTHVDRSTAAHAVKQIGPDAIPFLLRWAQSKDSPSKRKVNLWFEEHPFIHFRTHTDFYYQNMAFQGFAYLGSDARAARPALIQLTNSKEHRYKEVGLDCLAATSPDRETFLPILLRLIHDSDTNIQKQASLFLIDKYPEEAKAAGVYNLFP